MTLASLLSDMTVLATFLLIGFVILQFCKPLQKCFIPAAVIGGIVALICGPQVLNIVEIPESFSSMSTVLINVIPCAAVFGSTINRTKMRTYGDFLCVYIVTYGVQMVLSALVGTACESIWTDLPHGWGIMALFSFWGGHGTAAAAGAVFEQLGIEGNTQMGMIMSTIGLIVAMAGGMVVMNWGVRRGYAQKVSMEDAEHIKGAVPVEKRHPIGMERISSISMSNLMFQTALILFCIWGGKQIMGLITLMIPDAKSLPGMINGILGALILWPIMQKLGLGDYVDKPTVNAISGFCLEIVMISAIATLNLQMFATFIVPILLMSLVIITGCVVFSIFYTKRICKQDWFEKALGSFGQSTGSIPTGLALIRCVDPNAETSAADAIGIANSLTSPIYSTLSAVGPMILMGSLWTFVGVGAAIFAVPFIFSFVAFGRQK
ncbi:MAG: sodium:glutamate symporter [Lawsonibacter sp.]|nr:sodium:glutamate symporter [Lawsonibacter sp.]